MYSLLVDPDEAPKMTAKGVKRTWVDANLRHDTFVNVLDKRTVTYAEFYKITSRRQTLYTELLKKRCLDAFDDKRYLLDDGVTSLSYGHKDIPSSVGRDAPMPPAP